MGNGETPEGQDVVGTYSFPGTYTIKCTAQGRDENTVGTKSITVENGDPSIFSDINLLLSGYNSATSESETKWVWADGNGNMTAGSMEYDYDSCYFNPIDESWWQSSADEAADASVYDDEYQFKLNSTMEYDNNFGTAFMINWMWANVNFGTNPGIWEDVALETYEAPTASWSVEIIPNINDSISFQTNINGTMKDGAYVIHLTNSAYLAYGAAGSDYQICSIVNDTMLIRYDNHVPANIGDYYTAAALEEEGITAGEKEWDYVRLVKKQ